MTMTTEQAAWFAGTFEKLVANVGQAVLGKSHVIRLTFTAMLAEGHVLFEDAPGTGKTSLARALAATVQGSNNRIQFTPDLLPSDVTGVTIYDQKTQKFEFHKGPIFNNIVLADEINRASPKTQSALLEVMEESRVTVDGTTYEAGRPFMVMATQNPIEQAGTYRLPEAQLDRFLIKTSIGYPDHASTVQLLGGANLKDRSKEITAVITTQAIGDMADLAATTHVDTAVLEYISRLCEETRNAPETRLGVSVRGALAMVRAAKVWAASQGRNFVLPDDVKDLAGVVWTHRFVMDPEAEFSGATAEAVLARVPDRGRCPAAARRRLSGARPPFRQDPRANKGTDMSSSTPLTRLAERLKRPFSGDGAGLPPAPRPPCGPKPSARPALRWRPPGPKSAGSG